MKKLLVLSLMMAAMAMTSAAKDPIACPSNYYDNAVGKSDQALLTALYSIITNHTKISYDGLWDAYEDTDTDSDGYLIDMYSNYDKYKVSNKCGNYSQIGDCINREHSVPKSWWGGGSAAQYSDIFNIVPTDGYVNNQRSNYPYGVCENGTRLTNGNYVAKGRKGSSTRNGYTGVVFEPDDEYKGDFARAYFYMATCYNNIISNWTSSNGDAFFAGNSYPVFTTYAIDLLIEWHRLDPVSEKETTRNCYAHAWQNNRNPFIDHPELAEYIWGNKQGQTWNGIDEDVDTPYLASPANGGTIAVGTIASTGTNVSKDITVRGANLSADLTVSITGDDFTVTPATLSASDVNNGTTVTVTYSGNATSTTGTLTIASSEVSNTCTLTAGKESDTNPDPTVLTGDSIVETWETCENSMSYSLTSIQGAAFLWDIENAGTFDQSNDHFNGVMGCRFGKNNNSSIAMAEDVEGTSGISFWACNYGTSESKATLQVLYSTDQGASWNQVVQISLTNYELTQYSYALDVTDNVRFKFQQTAGARLNIDDIAIYLPAAEPVEPKVYFNGTIDEMTAEQNGESSISEATVVTEDNTDAVTVSVEGNFELSLDQVDWSSELTLDASGETFYVRLSSTAEAQTFEGTITATAGTAAAYADVHGEVYAAQVLVGDVNCDGAVNISDVTTLIDYLLGSNPNPFDSLAADVNQDGDINITDVTVLIDYLLGSSTMTWNALPAQGGINIENPVGTAIEIYNLDADIVATVNATQHVILPAGIYMVTSDTRSRKVVVK